MRLGAGRRRRGLRRRLFFRRRFAPTSTAIAFRRRRKAGVALALALRTTTVGGGGLRLERVDAERELSGGCAGARAYRLLRRALSRFGLVSTRGSALFAFSRAKKRVPCENSNNLILRFFFKKQLY
jgi:hypothetical protein